MTTKPVKNGGPNATYLAILASLLVFLLTVGIIGFFASHDRSDGSSERSLGDSAREGDQDGGSFLAGLFGSILSDENGTSETPAAKPMVTSDHPLANQLSSQPLNFSEIFALDDACLYQKLEDKDAARRAYFSMTSFQADFAEYEDVIGGYGSAVSRFGEFYLGLAYAHWLENGDQPSPYKLSFARAARILLALARSDTGNAAPAAWAMVAIEEALKENDPYLSISKGELEEAQALIVNAKRFDSYVLEHLRKLTTITDSSNTSAVSFLIKEEYHRTLAIPKWAELKNRLSVSPNILEADRIKLAELIAENAKLAKEPASAYGYSPLELKFAQSIVGQSRLFPTTEDIEQTFPSGPFPIWKAASLPSDEPCPPPSQDPFRTSTLEHLEALKKAGVGLGFSL